MHNKYVQSLDLFRVVNTPWFKCLVPIKKEHFSNFVCCVTRWMYHF